MTKKITVQGHPIQLSEINGEIYISLTDMTRQFGESNMLITSWIKRKDTLEYLGLWEKLHNKVFKPIEFDGFKNDAGTNRFSLSAQRWTEKTGAIGIISKSGRYGGTYAHEDIAMHFGQWLSPKFSLYVVKEFKRLKQVEAQKLSQDWQLNRALSKINYRIHTDSVDQHLIPSHTPSKLKWSWFTEEADILNMALFGKTARQWRNENLGSDGNIRDDATQEQLLVMANLEVLNSQFIKDKLSKTKRLQKLNEVAIEQMASLLKNASVKKLIN